MNILKMMVLRGIFFLALLPISQAHAQLSPGSLKTADKTDLLQEPLQQGLLMERFDPTLTAGYSWQVPAINLEASEENQRAVGQLSFPVGTSGAKISLKVSAPLSKTGGEVTPLDLYGLKKGAIAEIGGSLLRWKPKLSRANAVALQMAWGKAENARRAVRGDSVLADSVIMNQPLTKKDFKNDPALWKQYLGALDLGRPVVASFKVKFARQDFSYLTENFEEKKEQKVGVSGEFTLGFLNVSNTYIGLTGVWSRPFVPASSAEFVLPHPTRADVSTIKTLGIAAPEQKDKTSIGIEVRRYFGSAFSGDGKVGLQVSAWYLVQDKAVAVEVPLFFLAQKEKGLTSGIKMGWDSASKQVNFGVFLTKPFGLIP